MRLTQLAVLLISTVVFVGVSGCADKTGVDEGGSAHAHDHNLESLASGVEQLKSFQAEIKAAFDAGQPGDCDTALHEAAELLNVLPKAEDVSALSAESQEIVKTQAKKLFDLLMKIHDAGFHGAGDVAGNAYEDVAAEITAAIQELEHVAPASSNEE